MESLNLTVIMNVSTAGVDNTSVAPLLRNATYYTQPYRIVLTLFCSAIFFVGIIGNVMVVTVVTRTKSMHSPTNCYLVSLAVADIIVLVTTIPNEIIGAYLIVQEWLWGHVGCTLLIFLQYLGINASSLSITAFTIERYIAICHPMKAQVVCTMERAKKIIICVWTFAIIYNSPWIGLTTLEKHYYSDAEETEECTFRLRRDQYLWVFLFDFIMFYAVPLLMSCVLYALIARILFSEFVPKTPNASSNSQTIYSSRCTAHGHHGQSSASSSRLQVVKMLVVIVVLFAVLWVPYRFIVLYNSFRFLNKQPLFSDIWYFLFAKILIYINSAINPILYNAMSAKFRRAFRKLLSCGKDEECRGYYSRTMSTVV